MSTQPDRQNGDGLQATILKIIEEFPLSGIERVWVARHKLAASIANALSTQPARDAAEGAEKPVVRDTNMFSRLANEPPAVIPEGYSAPLDIRTAAEIEHDRLALRASSPKPAPDAPGHTDLTVTPESIDAFMEKNPLPAPDAMREALESLSDWCATERANLGAVDGYDYRSGEEFGLRCAEIEIKKRAGAISAPMLPADGTTSTFKTCLSCEMRQTCRDMNHCYGPSHAELKERFALSPPGTGAAEPVAWPDHTGATVDAVAFVEGVKRYPSMDRDASDLAIADKQAACQGAFIEGFKRAIAMRSAPPDRGDREAIAPQKHYFLPKEGEFETCKICGHNFRNAAFHCWGDERPETDAQYIGRLEALLALPVPPGAGERETTIEECARAAEQWASRIGCHASEIATDIRALSRQAPHSSSEGGR